ncbi:MAG: hypothetical protein ACLSG9_09960 [Eubacterium sp.]
MAVKRTGLGKGLDSMIPPKATQRAVKEDKNTISKTGETILKDIMKWSQTKTAKTVNSLMKKR